MAKDPAFLFYSQDFLVGTMAMPLDERGKYITILCYMHQNGHISEETIRLLVGSISDMLRLKFKQDSLGLFYNERMDLEVEKRNKFTESRKLNGLKGGRPSKDQQVTTKNLKKTYRLATDNLIEDENDNVNEVVIESDIKKNKGIEFENFWNLYDKKVGDKKSVCKKWDALKLEVQNQILAILPLWKDQFTDKQFQPFPETFLNQQRWNDEIIYPAVGKPEFKPNSGKSPPDRGFNKIVNTFPNHKMRSA